MLHFPACPSVLARPALQLVLGCWMFWAVSLSAADYFLTIGGGYDRSGNQASLEANVVFFQQLLNEKHEGPRRHSIFFADGDDPAADLQVLKEKTDELSRPATELLAALHRRRGGELVTYRNHRVKEITGPLDPALIRESLQEVAKSAGSGDRLILYVTAHGSEGPRNDPFNTTIDCWNGRRITARELEEWLSLVPAEVPVVMVMAQCYCGGFGRAIFERLEVEAGLAPQLRVGFFAQQHNLQAAGCRPDIEHDEEFSSYFWGALAGRSRNGVPIQGCDLDENGSISLAEAYAYAVIAGETIDIPLRTTEVYLRKFSRVADGKLKDSARDTGSDAEASEPSRQAPDDQPALLSLSGKLETFVELSGPVSRHLVTQLANQLEFSLQGATRRTWRPIPLLILRTVSVRHPFLGPIPEPSAERGTGS